jgi:hypothetical protein
MRGRDGLAPAVPAAAVPRPPLPLAPIAAPPPRPPTGPGGAAAEFVESGRPLDALTKLKSSSICQQTRVSAGGRDLGRNRDVSAPARILYDTRQAPHCYAIGLRLPCEAEEVKAVAACCAAAALLPTAAARLLLTPACPLRPTSILLLPLCPYPTRTLKQKHNTLKRKVARTATPAESAWVRRACSEHAQKTEQHAHHRKTRKHNRYRQQFLARHT